MSDMVLIVDFNMVEEDGRIPALLPARETTSLAPGTEVLAIDGEGTECRAVVDEVAADRSYVMLMPIGGTAHVSSAEAARPSR